MSFYVPSLKGSLLFWGIALGLLCALSLLFIIWFIRRAGRNRPDKLHKKTVWRRLRRTLSQLLARYGYIPSDPFSRSFLKALGVMRSFLAGRNFAYEVPWYLIMGPVDAGKSILMDSLNLDMPLGVVDLVPDEDAPCRWGFFNHGILLDLKGSVVFNQDPKEESSWRLLLDLLSNHRTKRPLDGVVLALPATLFLGALSEEEILAEAETLYLKLWQAQRILGLKLPVYIMITKCDAIAGFPSFCQELPSSQRHGIFGWSSPYPTKSTFRPSWVEEAFQEMQTQITYLQQEIFTEGKACDEADGVFVFGKEFLKLESRLTLFLTRLFRPNSYYEGSFFRGFYFCGDGQLRGGMDFAQSRSLFFGTDVFKLKIFPERGIAQPTKQRFFMNRQSIRVAQLFGLIVSAAGFSGLFSAYHELRKTQQDLLPSLKTAASIVQRAVVAGKESVKDQVFWDQQAHGMLLTLGGIRLDGLNSWLLPPSWISPLEGRLIQVVRLIYKKLILVVLQRKLQEQIHLVVEGKMPSSLDLRFLSSAYETDPLRTREFLLVQEYLDRLYRLQTVALKMNSLGELANLDSFSFIVRKLLRYNLPKKFYQNETVYVRALREASLDPFPFQDYKKQATAQFRKMYDRFLLTALSPAGLLPDLPTLSRTLTKLSLERKQDPKAQLEQALQKMTRIMSPFGSPQISWLAQDTFNPGKAFEDFLHRASACSFFDASTVGYVLRSSNRAFAQLKAELTRSYAEPLMGNLFSFHGDRIHSSEKMLKMQGLFNIFFNEPFMKKADARLIATQVPSGAFLAWDFNKLQSAKTLAESYSTFCQQKILSFPKPLVGVFKKTALNEFQKNLRSLLSQAQNFIPQDQGGSYTAPEDVLLSEVQALRAVSGVLKQLLRQLRPVGATAVYEELKQVLTRQCLTLLDQLSAILDAEGPYAVRTDSFGGWKGDELGILYAFGTFDDNELKNHLHFQRDRIFYLAKEFAEPAVQLLSFVVEGMHPPVSLARWQGILTQINLYNRKIPGNSIALLEESIFNDLRKISLKNCHLRGETPILDSRSTDFFLQKRASLKKALTSRCAAMALDTGTQRYADLASYFNTYLAGHFPFAPAGQDTDQEANLGHVQRFYEMFAEKGQGLSELIQAASLPSQHVSNALSFLKMIEALQPLFKPILGMAPGDVYQPLDIQMVFRVNTAAEKNANQLIEWGLDIDNTFYSATQKKVLGKWSYGAPIEARFRWARGSTLRPFLDPSRSSFLLPDPTEATLSYGGQWALLRLINQQKSPLSFSRTEANNQTLLRFTIPTVEKISVNEAAGGQPINRFRDTVVFIGLEILEPIKGGVRTIQVSEFPLSAPPLDWQESGEVEG